MFFTAVSRIRKIKLGGTAKLSKAEITMCVINLSEAKKNLSPEDYEKVYSLFSAYIHDKKSRQYDSQSYLSAAREIIAEFDMIAPYSLFSGDNASAVSLYKETDQKREKRKTIAKCNESIRMAKNALKQAQQNISEVTIDDINRAFKAGLISEEKRKETSDALQAQKMIAEAFPKDIAFLEELLAKEKAEFMELYS